LILKVGWRQGGDQEEIANAEGNLLQNLVASPVSQGIWGEKVGSLLIVVLNDGYNVALEGDREARQW
jgi:hypothetical protein